MIKPIEFEFEGDKLRIRGLEDDSGVSETGKAGMRKWSLDHKAGYNWVRDMVTYLPNETPIEAAFKAFNMTMPGSKVVGGCHV